MFGPGYGSKLNRRSDQTDGCKLSIIRFSLNPLMYAQDNHQSGAGICAPAHRVPSKESQHWVKRSSSSASPIYKYTADLSIGGASTDTLSALSDPLPVAVGSVPGYYRRARRWIRAIYSALDSLLGVQCAEALIPMDITSRLMSILSEILSAILCKSHSSKRERSILVGLLETGSSSRKTLPSLT
ncbi:disease resistance protein [Dorcoceras hygrometricum]|uniref:Disease resistance protein n=1 Tax=Dorcoceras hygrometricum TaxID=472368 RepID=A0A2Z7C813_9LAMI|nr:disease resistance protein [Dorcoceras hygrometricum]